MKKTLLAVTIPALFAVSAHAATVYDKDGQTFDLTGRAQANLYDKEAAVISGYDTNATTNTLVGTGRFGVKGTTAITSQVSAFARGEWQVNAEKSNASSSNFKARHEYLGFDGGQAGKILFGQTDTAFYDTLAATDIFNEWGDEVYQSSRQEGQAIYSGSWGGYRASAGYQFADASQGLSNAYNASLGYTFASGFGVGAGAEGRNYDQVAANTSSTDSDNRWALSTSYGTFGKPGIYAAALYVQAEQSYFAGVADTTKKGWELASAFTTENKWTFLAGYNRYYQTVQDQDVTAYYMLGAQYDFTSNFKSYFEYRLDEGKSAGVDNKDAVTLAAQYNF